MSSTEQDLDNAPIATSNAITDQVPIIDLSGLMQDSSSQATQDIAQQIADACRDWGFFQVINHDISEQLIQRVWDETSQMFALPNQDKLAVLRTKENPWGYYNNELTKNQRDKKEVFDFTNDGVDPIYGQSNRWLVDQEQFKTTMQAYFEACTNLSLKLLEAFCIGLNLSADFMHADFANNHTGFLRLNYYPVKDPLADIGDDKSSVADMGVHHHTDAGALTVLLQDDVGGLQVFNKGCWHNIPSVPGALVINTGDMMQVWSNDNYQAAIHRVLAMQSVDRFSLPFFFNPAATAQVKPLPTVVDNQNPSRYKTIEWAAFRGKRTDGDYADYGAEVQISQFRI